MPFYCKHLEKVPNPFLCLKWVKNCKWQRLSSQGTKWQSATNPGRKLYGCHKVDLEWERGLRKVAKSYTHHRLPRECESIEREMKLTCPICHTRQTHTIICEPCFDKVQLAKIKWVMLGKDAEVEGGNA